MKKVLLLLVVAMLVAATSAWAQDALLAGHNVGGVKGCKSCHAPHNGAVMNGGSNSATGEIYLWGRDLKAATYNTFGGGSFTTVANPLETDPVVHTQMCLSCHDGGITDTTMAASKLIANDGGTVLTNDHPVHIAYAPATITRPYNWNITITAATSTTAARVSFADTTFVAGHPARLYLDAAATTAYIECSTCHNPHSNNRAVVKILGVNTVKTSSKFVRGWYDPADGASQANFCRSCHLSKSDQYTGAVL